MSVRSIWWARKCALSSSKVPASPGSKSTAFRWWDRAGELQVLDQTCLSRIQKEKALNHVDSPSSAFISGPSCRPGPFSHQVLQAAILQGNWQADSGVCSGAQKGCSASGYLSPSSYQDPVIPRGNQMPKEPQNSLYY